MHTSIRLATTYKPEDSLILVMDKKSGFPTGLLSKQELDYVNAELKADRNNIIINQYHRFVAVHQLNRKKSGAALLEACRKVGDALLGAVNRHKLGSIVIVDVAGHGPATSAIAEGMALSNYQFLKYKTKNNEPNTLKEIRIQSTEVVKRDIELLNIVVDSVCKARTLVNEPQSYLNATVFSQELARIGKEAGVKVEVLSKAKIESLKMGGLLAVNMGSKQPPTFTIMEYKPRKAKNKKPYVLVGKGVVYDTGGLSLKPTPNSMDYMKCDMAGGAVAGCAIYAIAKAKLPVHVIALIPATDNRPGEDAYTPGDVVTMMSGQTVEVLNTDAEGRMLLADALHYAKRYEPKAVFDFATLTGAAAAAIGPYGIVCMGTADEKTKAALHAAGEEVYERLAEFPFWDEYDDLIKSDVADMKNIGGPIAGAITAGKFLERFVDYPWMHFDIAGPAYLLSNSSYRGKHGTGTGVRLMFEFFRTR
ncbi:MAG: leucyl aminopeptidase family protein [Bacteroidota bacterium]